MNNPKHHEHKHDQGDWIVGLELGERSRGALVFSRWLGEGADRVTGIFVVETWSRPHIASDIATTVHHAITETTRQLGITPPARVTVTEAVRAEEALAHAAEGGAGLVIGRAARVEGEGPVRLGPVTRRLLRVLPGPIVIVPRDLTAVAPGPILVATDLGASTAAALAFAQTLAARHARPLEVVHIAEPRHNDLIDELEPRWLAAREQHRADMERSLDAWMRDRHLGRPPRHVAYGDAAEKIAEIAAARQAALVVVGSRRLGSVARLFLSSTASRLAGLAVCPVAVVPPE